MGLNITAYAGLKWYVPDGRELVILEGNGVDSLEYREEHDINELYIPPDCGGHAEGIQSKYFTLYCGVHSFRAGSYTAYSAWRETLARVAGYGVSNNVWENGLKGPFTELINFSDCEGTIGPVVSKKLYDDFTTNEKKLTLAVHLEDHVPFGIDSWLAVYKEFIEAFRLASEDGAVQFH